MDGTIVDTETHWLEAQRQLLVDHGLPPLDARGEELLVGANMDEAAAFFISCGVPLEADDIIDTVNTEVLRRFETGLHWRPGALELLSELAEAGIPSALVTNSMRVMVDTVLAELPFAAFEAIVSADDVTRGKPHPEPYLRGATLLGGDPRACIAIEDSRTGLRAARAAGMFAIGVPHGMALGGEDADVLLPTLHGLDVEGLCVIYAGDRRQAGARP